MYYRCINYMCTIRSSPMEGKFDYDKLNFCRLCEIVKHIPDKIHCSFIFMN